mmetsp:Transcript_113110/g.314880  ORF Transcript_113110/g.314880 Transcript_113110/m.314880 type:complete len:224 (-) Transcript_113110:188-859(-)
MHAASNRRKSTIKNNGRNLCNLARTVLNAASRRRRCTSCDCANACCNVGISEAAASNRLQRSARWWTARMSTLFVCCRLCCDPSGGRPSSGRSSGAGSASRASSASRNAAWRTSAPNSSSARPQRCAASSTEGQPCSARTMASAQPRTAASSWPFSNSPARRRLVLGSSWDSSIGPRRLSSPSAATRSGSTQLGPAPPVQSSSGPGMGASRRQRFQSGSRSSS